MSPAEVVREYWRRTQERDWDGVRALLSPDLVVEWPVSGERFTGPETFVGVNRAYPEGWAIRVRRVVQDGDTVVSEVLVPHVEFGPSIAVSWWTVTDGLVSAAREYWTEPGSQTPPHWRGRFATAYDPLADQPPADQPPGDEPLAGGAP